MFLKPGLSWRYLFWSLSCFICLTGVGLAAEPQPAPVKPWLNPDLHLRDHLEQSRREQSVQASRHLSGADWNRDPAAEETELSELEEDSTDLPQLPTPCLSSTFDRVHHSVLDSETFRPRKLNWHSPSTESCQANNGLLALSSDPRINRVLLAAQELLGVPYKYGGETPEEGLDCSGLVLYALKQEGFELPRTAHAQYRATHPIQKAELQPGDLVFFRIRRGRHIDHVGIYLGESQFIHAPSHNKHVTIAKLDDGYWKRRFVRGGRFV